MTPLRTAPAGRLQKQAASGGAAAGLHVVVPSLDGHVYIVEGGSGCTNKASV
ncbi:unnamed protein product, partial [Phaeothamnion confervicola]